MSFIFYTLSQPSPFLGRGFNKKKKMKKILMILIVLLLLPSILWYAAVPDSAIPYLVASRTAGLGLQVKAKNFRKGPFLNFSADAISAGADGKPALVLEDVRGHMNPLSLFLLRLRTVFSARLAGGSVKGVYTYGLFSGQSRVRTEIENVRISELPLVKGSVSGDLGASLAFKGDQNGGRGSLIFSLKDLQKFPYGFRSANGVIDITPGEIRAKSISLESEGVYAKLKGSLENGTYNINMEITSETPNPLLSRYQVSAGYYVIPLSGQLRQLL